MIKLSYILPVYGVEAYIESCLDSIYRQSLSEDEFEVICVDDKSKDNSIEIVSNYQKTHSNIVIYTHDTNKKAGGARNTGVRIARGEYVWFVDSDDLIEKGSAKKLIDECLNNSLDVLCFNLVLHSSTNEVKDIVFRMESATMDGCEFLEKEFGAGLIYNLGYPVRAVYKREVITVNHIQFAEGITYGEETTFMAEVIAHSKRVKAIPDCLYIYRQNESSATHQLEKQWRGDLIYQSVFAAGCLIEKFRSTVATKSESLSNHIEQGMPWFVNRLFMRLVKTNHSGRLLFYDVLKENIGKDDIHSLLAYMDNKNRFVVKHPQMGLLTLEVLSLLYKLKRSFFHGRN